MPTLGGNGYIPGLPWSQVSDGLVPVVADPPRQAFHLRVAHRIGYAGWAVASMASSNALDDPLRIGASTVEHPRNQPTFRRAERYSETMAPLIRNRPVAHPGSQAKTQCTPLQRRSGLFRNAWLTTGSRYSTGWLSAYAKRVSP